MTTSQMNAEIFRSLSILAESEDMLARAAKYLRKLAKEQQQKAEPTLMSKEEYFQKLDEAEESIAQGQGKNIYPPGRNESLA